QGFDVATGNRIHASDLPLRSVSTLPRRLGMRFSKKGIAVLRLPSRRNTLRPIERPLAWLAGLALALCAGTAAGAAGGPSSVAFWYAERPPLAE
ncbi:hypothetical protein QVM80_26835, partial [Enterobacter hormaechei]|uniref:hypothetical protein n=1 Tax=Enterobacter hormaechei TaxID=158836 RepID=UPI0035253E5E